MRQLISRLFGRAAEPDDFSLPLLVESALDAQNPEDRLLVCLERVRAHEAMAVSATSFRAPYYYWKTDAGEKDTRLTLAERLAPLIAEKCYGWDVRMTALALSMRLAQVSAEIEAAVNKLQLDDIKDFATPLVSETLTLLHTLARFKKLHAFAEYAIGLEELEPSQRALFSDYYFQSAYQLIKEKIFQNTLTEADREGMRRALEKCSQTLGEGYPNLGHYRGLLACVEGDLQRAITLHVSVEKGGYNSQFFRAATNLVPLNHITDLVKRGAKGNEQGASPTIDFRHAAGGEATLISCDSGYYYAFARGFIESFARQNPGGTVHLHCIDFTPPDKHLIELEECLPVKINVTTDEGPQDATPDLWKGYCAGARYIHLPLYLAHYDRVIVNDIDGIVHTSMADVWKGREGKIHLSSPVFDGDRKGHFAFWSNIGAGAFGITNAPAHKEFAQTLAAYLRERLDVCARTGERFFFSDQVGLLLCALALGETDDYVRMRQIFSQSSQMGTAGRHRAKKDAQAAMLDKQRTNSS